MNFQGNLTSLPDSLEWRIIITKGSFVLHFSMIRYIFFVTLLSIPESSFTVAFKMFDLDNNG